MDKQNYKRTRGTWRKPQNGNTHYSKQHWKEYQTRKRQAMMEYMVSASRNSPPFTAA